MGDLAARHRRPRQRRGRAGARRPRAVRVPAARGRAGRPLLGDDPAQARGLSQGVRRLRSKESGALHRGAEEPADEQRRDRAQPAEDRQRRDECPRISRRAKRIRQLRRLCLALRRRQAARQSRQQGPGEDRAVRCAEQGSAQARLQVCRLDHLLCVHAGRGDGRRPCYRLLPQETVMRTAIIIAAGLVIAAVFLLAGRFFGRGRESMLIFIALWLIAAAVNMWFGVAKAGYSFIEELPIFLVIFALPAAAAGYIWWRYS